jgi:hypothetical protein
MSCLVSVSLCRIVRLTNFNPDRRVIIQIKLEDWMMIVGLDIVDMTLDTPVL